MTTIAANRESMAGDSQLSWEGNKGFSTPKVFRIGTSIYGIAGDCFGSCFIEWAEKGFNQKQKPTWGPKDIEDVDFDVLELSPTGLWLWDKHLVRMKVKDDNYSIGSGSKFALVFMRKLGMSPEEAVKECCEWDDYTRGPIDVLYLKELLQKNETTTKKS